ncbi:F420H(2):quinone oxidoreductase [Haloglomus irregulare]|jgi:NAD(P)H-flavin reductase|uniref:F420H(2):quinone oxidoreductase n=1 Tax=Haloglomus irregulare TaxID=2234134 RepID=A0A554MUF8_9EURY|nr:FAD-dependent oxidoreductase [Haloglomus irregulare]TSD08757.1 F420H(2):quinone oxidoreductase [Haloglomus irregulare]
MSFSRATITGITDISPDCRQYVVELDDGEFAGEAGQHTAIRTDDGVKPYSVLAVDGARVGLMLRAYGTDGVADYMDARSVGDTVQVKPTLTGSLRLQGTDRPAVFVGTGTGITPLIGLLQAYVTGGGGPHAVFVFGEKTREQLLYKSLLEQYELAYPVEARFSLSREDWHGHTGYVQEQLPDVVESVGANADYYACGVPAAVVAAKERLDELDVPSERVHTEGWEDAQVA